MPADSASEVRMEQAMGRLLQVGVLVSAVIVAVGGVLFLIGHGGETPDFHQFHPAGEEGSRTIRIGILVMVATPVLRVLFAVAAFAKARDYLYTMVSLIVFGLLVWSFRGFL